MDSYGSRGNSSKFQANKNQTKAFRNNNSGRSVRSQSEFSYFRTTSPTFLLISLQYDDEMHGERDRNDDYYAKKSKKPEYYPQQQQNPGSKSEKARYERSYDNRQSRQGSEPRAASGNNFSNQDSMKSTFVNSERNRDTRSSEPGGGNHYDHRNKPPSGQQRIGNSAFQRLPMNIDSLPPRLRKKCLEEAGLSEDSLIDKPIMEMTQKSYSNTLPSGRGRNNRYDQQNYHYQSNYQPKYQAQSQGYHEHEPNHQHRSLTPPASKSGRLQQHQQQHKPTTSGTRYEWKSTDRRDESSPAKSKTTTEDQNFDWSEDVMNSQSLPHDVNNTTGKYDDNNRHRHRRRRNRR